MALTKRTVDKIIKKNDFQNSMKAELIFTDFTKDEDERIEALEFISFILSAAIVSNLFKAPSPKLSSRAFLYSGTQPQSLTVLSLISI